MVSVLKCWEKKMTTSFYYSFFKKYLNFYKIIWSKYWKKDWPAMGFEPGPIDWLAETLTTGLAVYIKFTIFKCI